MSAESEIDILRGELTLFSDEDFECQEGGDVEDGQQVCQDTSFVPSPLKRGEIVKLSEHQFYTEVDTYDLTLQNMYHRHFTPFNHLQQQEKYSLKSVTNLCDCLEPHADDERGKTNFSNTLKLLQLRFLQRQSSHTPTPYEIINFCISKQLKALEESAVSTHRELHDGAWILAPMREQRDVWDAELNGDSLLTATALANVTTQRIEGLRILYEKVKRDTHIARSLPDALMHHLIREANSLIESNTQDFMWMQFFVMVLGLIICQRGQLGVLLKYTRTLERFLQCADDKMLRTPHCTHADEIIHSLLLPRVRNKDRISPINVLQEGYCTLSVNIKDQEGNLQCMCVSPDGSHIAAVLDSHLILFSRADEEVIGRVELDEEWEACWNLCFTTDSKKIIATDRTGTKHLIYSSDLSFVCQATTSAPGAPENCIEGSEQIRTRDPPFLSSGSTHSLHLLQCEKGIKKCFSELEEVNCITIAVLLGVDYEGSVAVVETRSGNTFSVVVKDHVLHLTTVGQTSYAPLQGKGKWMALHIHWDGAEWNAKQDGSTLQWCCSYRSSLKQIVVSTITVLEGKGHIGHVAIWSSRSARDECFAAASFVNRASKISNALTLLYYPLDEGMGPWIKNLASNSCDTLPKSKSFVWDESWGLVPPPPYSHVQMTSSEFLSRRFLSSAHSIYLLPFGGASDDNTATETTVVEVDRTSNTVKSVYQCHYDCTRCIYSLRYDEKEIFLCEPRLLIFKSARLFSNKAIYRDLSSRFKDASDQNSFSYVLNELCKRVFVYGVEMFHTDAVVDAQVDIFDVIEELNQLEVSTTTPIRTAAVLSLFVGYIQAISEGKTLLSSLDLKNMPLEKIQDIRKYFSHHGIALPLAETAVKLATVSNYSIEQKCDLLFDFTPEKKWKLFFEVFSDKVLASTIYYAASHNKDSKIAELFLVVLKEVEIVPPHSPFLQRVQPFLALASAILRAFKNAATIRLMIKEVCSFVDERICSWTTLTYRNANLNSSVLLQGIITFIVSISTSCQLIFSNTEVESQIIKMIAKIRQQVREFYEEVEFSSSTLYELNHSPLNADSIWCFTVDFSESSSICIQKNLNESPVRVLMQGNDSYESADIYLRDKNTTVKGDVISLTGHGRNTIKITAHYSFLVNTSLLFTLLECFEQFILKVCQHLLLDFPACSMKLPSAFRYGLTSDALRRNNIDIAYREAISTYSKEILEGSGRGRELTENVFHNMRGSILPSMKPAIQSLLAVLIHCGASEHEAEKELRLNWFSGNWGINFQGSQREVTLTRLREVAEWVISRIHYEKGFSSYSHNASRQSQTAASSFLTTINRISPLKDLLDAIRIIISKKEGTAQLEEALLTQTWRALYFCRAVDLLCALLKTKASEQLIQTIVGLMLKYNDKIEHQHLIENLFGAGVELEEKVRISFHELLKSISFSLLDGKLEKPDVQSLLSAPMPKSWSILGLLSLYGYPWDEADYQLMFGNSMKGESKIWMLEYLKELTKIPFDLCKERYTANCTVTKKIVSVQDVQERMDKIFRVSLASVCLPSIGLSKANNFSVCIPQVLVFKSKEQTINIRKNTDSRLVLRADDAWAVTGNEITCIQYFEVRIQTVLPAPLTVGLTKGAAAYEDASSNFVAGICTDGSTVSSDSDDESYRVNMVTGDVLGCGLDTARRIIFFTRNGVFWRSVRLVNEDSAVYPTLIFSEGSGVSVCVNFGATSFVFDYLRLHPFFMCHKSPTWYNIFYAADAVSRQLTNHICVTPSSINDDYIQSLKRKCIQFSLAYIRKTIDASAMYAKDSDDTTIGRMKKVVTTKITVDTLLNQISTLRNFCQLNSNSELLSDISSTLFEAINLTITYPFHSTAVATLQLIRDSINDFVSIPAEKCRNLVKTMLYMYDGEIKGETKGKENTLCPFFPHWTSCDSQNVSLMSSTYATMNPKSRVSIILGNSLPYTGEVSFSVSIQKKESPKGRSLQSGYYIGVAKKDIYSFDPLQSWKAKGPPCVWALHDVSPQLPHATNPSVPPNTFMRAFGSGERITVHLDRESGCLSFFRDDEFLSKLFVDVPSSMDLVPFVQLYNEDASATLYQGSMTPPITELKLFTSVLAEVLRGMLRVPLFDCAAAEYIIKDLTRKSNSTLAFLTLNGALDPTRLELDHGGKRKTVQITEINNSIYRYKVGKAHGTEKANAFRLPTVPKIVTKFYIEPQDSVAGYSVCIRWLIGKLFEYAADSKRQSLLLTEAQRRSAIIDNEATMFEILSSSVRRGIFDSITRMQQDPIIDLQNDSKLVFSPALSSPHMHVVPQFLGKLIKLRKNAPGLSSFIGMADPILPDQGVFDLLCRIRRGEESHVLGGGYYFGICTDNFSFRCTDFARRDSKKPQVWALHDADNTNWRLKHMNSDVTFDDGIAFYSGDTIRLSIDRDAGTMDAFRKPYKGDEIALGRIFNKIPVEPLRAFVCLYNNDASAVLLNGGNDMLALRVTVPKLFYSTFNKEKVFCSSCSMNQADEVQLVHDWYKCNDCENYALCSECFHRCLHPQHEFTLMSNARPALHCQSVPWDVRKGMLIYFHSSPAMLLRSYLCGVPDGDIGRVAKSSADGGFAVWGLVSKSNRFSINITTSNRTSFSDECPVFVGVTTNEKILSMPQDEVKRYIHSHSGKSEEEEVILVCSDPCIDEKGEASSVAGFTEETIIAFQIDVRQKVVNISKDWVFHRRAELRTSTKYVRDTHAFCFVLFSDKNQKAIIYPENGHSISPGIVEDVQGRIVVVQETSSQRRHRVIPKEQCRMPLYSLINEREQRFCKDELKKDGIVAHYFDGEKIKSGDIRSLKHEEVAIIDHQSKHKVMRPCNEVFIDPFKSKTSSDYRLNSDFSEFGPKYPRAWKIFSILLILSSMSQSSVLLKIINNYTSPLFSALESIASCDCTQISSAGIVDTIRRNLRDSKLWSTSGFPKRNCLTMLVKPIVYKERIHLENDAVVTVFNDAEELYRVHEIESDAVSVISETGVIKKINDPENCLTVKTNGAKPWCVVPNGLPSSKREHNIRKINHDPLLEATLNGSWRGELTIRSSSVRINLSLEEEYSFHNEAFVELSFETKKYFVYYEYYRYERHVRFIMLAEEHYRHLETFSGKRWDELISLIEAKKWYKDDIFIARAIVQHSGMQFSGTYRLLDKSNGSMSLRLLDRHPLQYETHGEVQVLPDCARNTRECVFDENTDATLSSTVILVARHLYMILSLQQMMDLTHFARNIHLFHSHRLATLASRRLSLENARDLLKSAADRIIKSETNVTDSGGLARFILLTLCNNNFYRRLSTYSVWDSLHAVVFSILKCGPIIRSELLILLGRFIDQKKVSLEASQNYFMLVSSLFTHADMEIDALDHNSLVECRRDIAAIVELLLRFPLPVMNSNILLNIPVNSMKCLIDLQVSMENGEHLPRIVQLSDSQLVPPAKLKCLFGDMEGNFLKIGKFVAEPAAPRARVYYEVLVSKEDQGTYAIGWGTEQHRRAADTHVGTDSYSFAFVGNAVLIGGTSQNYTVQDTSFLRNSDDVVVGCLLDLTHGSVAWSKNGVVGPFIPITSNHLLREEIYAFASLNGGNGLTLLLNSSEFHYPQEGYTDIRGIPCIASTELYDSTARSNTQIRSKDFFIQLSRYLSCLRDRKRQGQSPENLLKEYPLISECTSSELMTYENIILTIESGIVAAENFIDLEQDQLNGQLTAAFFYFKPLLREFIRLRLANLKTFESTNFPKEIEVRLKSDSSSSSPAAEPLSETVFFQCYKQLSSLPDSQWKATPLFRVHLFLSESGHFPIDMGGPYRQTWSLIAEEIMKYSQGDSNHAVSCRRSIFRFCNNSKRVFLVPDEQLDSPQALSLFVFFGKLIGYAARCNLSLDIELSPYVWKYMVDERLDIGDYYRYVDSVIMSSMNDRTFFSSGMAEELISGLKEKLPSCIHGEKDTEKNIDIMQRLAEECLVHSLDLQLRAIRDGLSSILSRRALRCLHWKDLEHLVCGIANPSLKDLKKYIKCSLSVEQEKHFWDIVQEMNAEQKSALLCFACGQRRLPLIRVISVVQNAEGEDHLPRAQSCSSLISVPVYRTMEKFREKLFYALQHQNEMELA